MGLGFVLWVPVEVVVLLDEACGPLDFCSLEPEPIFGVYSADFWSLLGMKSFVSWFEIEA